MKITDGQIIRAINRGEDSSGGYGSYYRLTQKVGIKVIGQDGKGGRDTLEALLKSKLYKDAKKEYTMLKIARRRSKMVVKPYKLRVFHYPDDEAWYVGILMEHISGPTLAELGTEYEEEEEEIMEMLMKKMKKLNVFIRDHNPQNFIKQRVKGWRIIDFSPGWVHVKA